MAGPYHIMYADPPWDYKGQLQHNGAGGRDTGGALRHYPTMTAKQMACLDIGRYAAEDCLLFLWATSPHLDQAIDLGKNWGFAWATVAFVWDKEKTNPGFYTLSQCELCLVMKRGRIPVPRGVRNIRQMVRERRRYHSAKPDEVRCRIERMFPHHKRLELFARERHKGWDCVGKDMGAMLRMTAEGVGAYRALLLKRREVLDKELMRVDSLLEAENVEDMVARRRTSYDEESIGVDALRVGNLRVAR